MAAAVAVVVVRNRAVRTRIRNRSEHHSVPVVSGVVSAVVSAVSVVSYNVSLVFSVHYKINKKKSSEYSLFCGGLFKPSLFSTRAFTHNEIQPDIFT